LAGLLRPGNAGSNTAADHIQVLRWALESLPADYRPTPRNPGGPKIVVRCDSAGATHAFAQACRVAGVGFSFGYAVDARVRDAVEMLNTTDSRYPAIDSGGGIRDGAWVTEARLRLHPTRPYEKSRLALGRKMTPIGPEPGWYFDPDGGDNERFWNGEAWTEHRRLKPSTSSPPSQLISETHPQNEERLQLQDEAEGQGVATDCEEHPITSRFGRPDTHSLRPQLDANDTAVELVEDPPGTAAPQ
jgi:hypothetical protein